MTDESSLINETLQMAEGMNDAIHLMSVAIADDNYTAAYIYYHAAKETMSTMDWYMTGLAILSGGEEMVRNPPTDVELHYACEILFSEETDYSLLEKITHEGLLREIGAIMEEVETDGE